ncbi:MAG: ATP-binding protein [Coleofasciculus sp. D1-CHI-01]|uniref:ATP-binding protein n=1 Tax=Coleofasciculus sp. D1-CHI-01 TaxID=3068482 RepID=UPI0033017A5A
MTNDNPVRILLIDDNPDDRMLALRRLEQEFEQLQSKEITDIKQLQQILAERKFDIVVTDYSLRWSNGLNVLHQVKQQYPDCPVVMFTGTGNEEVAVEAMKSGLDDYIIKSPQHYTRLAAAVRGAWERSKQHQAFKEMQQRYQQLFESVPIGLYRMTPTGQIIEANPTLLQLLGYPSLQALLDTNISKHLVDTQANRLWQSQIDCEGVVRDLEIPMRRCDNTMIWVRYNARAISNAQGEVMYYEGAIEDVTQRKQAEAERTQLLKSEQASRAEAETANRLKDEFLATLSHELRTPLNAILGWAGLLRRKQLSPDKVERALEVIERNAKSQAQLIDDLLDVSRIIRGNLRLTVIPVDLQQVINAAIDTLQPAADAKSIQIDSFLEPSQTVIKGDSDRLQQIFWNLLSNAIKFTPTHGQVNIYLEWLENAVQIRVQDTGKGVSVDIAPYIFDRFRQAEGSITRSHGGLGLGLAIVRHLVELHGGTVWCESDGDGKGATFTVELPLKPQADAESVGLSNPS